MHEARWPGPLSIAVKDTDVDVCRCLGLDAELRDMHDLDGKWDAVWARHVLERRPAPVGLVRFKDPGRRATSMSVPTQCRVSTKRTRTTFLCLSWAGSN
jgi:hypothetical protein